MCSEIIYDNVFRNRLQQSVQKSPLHCVHELPLWCVYIIATLVFTNVRIAFCLKMFCVRCRCRRVFVVCFFSTPRVTFLDTVVFEFFYVKSKLCGVSNQWEEKMETYIWVLHIAIDQKSMFTPLRTIVLIQQMCMYIICQSDGQLEFIYCVDVALVCSKYCIPCIYGFKYWTLYIFLIYECI